MGAFDPLEELAAVARRYGLWLHVDGAHGASLLLSDRHRHRLRGIEQADSLTWDAHKMLFMPAPCTLLFYRDGAAARGAFRQRASYVFDEEPDVYSAYDSADKNFECTKRPMIMPLWTVWSVYGPALFAQKIDRLCAVARQAYRMLAAEPDFAVAHEPESEHPVLPVPAGRPGTGDRTPAAAGDPQTGSGTAGASSSPRSTSTGWRRCAWW